jgi:hypothetical protein
MSGRQIATILGAAAALAATAGAAQAADAPKPMDFTVHPDPAAAVAPAGPKALRLDARRGRWGVTLNLQQPDTRESTLNDIQAGAYYHITPSLRVGGSLAFGEQQVVPGPKPNAADTGQPRVQLETKFKF